MSSAAEFIALITATPLGFAMYFVLCLAIGIPLVLKTGDLIAVSWHAVKVRIARWRIQHDPYTRREAHDANADRDAAGSHCGLGAAAQLPGVLGRAPRADVRIHAGGHLAAPLRVVRPSDARGAVVDPSAAVRVRVAASVIEGGERCEYGSTTRLTALHIIVAPFRASTTGGAR